MTYQTGITPAGTTEEPQGFTHSPVSREFSRLLVALRTAVDAELDTLDIDVFDIAFKDWVAGAEHAWRVVAELVQKTMRHKPMRDEDDELRHVAALIGFSTYLEHSEDCHAYNLLVRDYSPIFPCGAETATGRHTGQMITIAREWFRTLDIAVLGRTPTPEAQAAAM
ncbi:MAG: hypothetical protein WEB56_08385 [Roseovarius sp.]